MGDVAVQKRPAILPLTDPSYGTLDGSLGDNNDYAKLKRLQRHLEYVFPDLGDGSTVGYCDGNDG